MRVSATRNPTQKVIKYHAHDRVPPCPRTHFVPREREKTFSLGFPLASLKP